MIMNVSSPLADQNTLAQVFSLFGQPVRLKIVLAIGSGHVCVCHLEKALGLRQASISQQLMALRAGGLVKTERIGRHIFYSLTDPRWLDLIQTAAGLKGIVLPVIELPEIYGCSYSSCANSNPL
jgi:ArsR family transcriptional regulator